MNPLVMCHPRPNQLIAVRYKSDSLASPNPTPESAGRPRKDEARGLCCTRRTGSQPVRAAEPRRSGTGGLEKVPKFRTLPIRTNALSRDPPPRPLRVTPPGWGARGDLLLLSNGN
jgi:hypothetical protein